MALWMDLQWDLMDDNGKRYTNETLQSTWTITFPDAKGLTSANEP